MLKRLIEVALPLKEVSEQSAREKSIRHGHISTLHIWWARRPLAACRAAVFASLIPDPDDPECPKEFKKLVMELLKHERYRPSGQTNGQPTEDTPRNRCLEFIKHLVKWENSNNTEFIEPARILIAAAYKFLHPGTEDDAPKVLDPFAGGGAIPLEALRLGCDTHAVELNPVAHLLQLCTLVYPQKYGQPSSRPIPKYIGRLIDINRKRKMSKGGKSLFHEDGDSATACDDIILDVDISEAEYRRNPLAADVKYWGLSILAEAQRLVGKFYSSEPKETQIAYLWARTIPCPNPACQLSVPLIHQCWLSTNPKKLAALRLIPDVSLRKCRVEIARGSEIDFDADEGTMSRTSAQCPACKTVIAKTQLETHGCQNGFGSQLLAVVSRSDSGKDFRPAGDPEEKLFCKAQAALKDFLSERDDGLSVPSEPLPYLRSIFNVNVYGLNTWGRLFNDRQLLTLLTFCDLIRRLPIDTDDAAYSDAIRTYLGLCLDRLADYDSTLVRWVAKGEFLGNTFGRQALPMVWDFCEGNPFGGSSGDWAGALDWIRRAIETSSLSSAAHAHVIQGDATRLSIEDNRIACCLTDPPYYDAVPYADCSDFFYVWLKRSLLFVHPSILNSPLTPKRPEITQLAERNKSYSYKTKANFEERMTLAFSEMCRVTDSNGVVVVVFAHKTTAAWETLVSGLLTSGLAVTSSWPLSTEMQARLRAKESAALASSIFMVCRKRQPGADTGLWDDVRKELHAVAKERLDFFWAQGIRGADFFISAIGPALSVFGRYDQVTRLDGEPVSVGQFLDEVRAIVTNYALGKILKTTHTGSIDPESRFYVVWKWSYGEAKLPAGEAFVLAQALGIETDLMWDRTGVLQKAGENVQAVPVAKRMKIKDLGEPNPDGSAASLIDVLHRLCVFREKNDAEGMAEFLARSGQGGNASLWLVAQAISEILPDGDKEKQLMQGLLNQKDQLEAAQGRLF